MDDLVGDFIAETREGLEALDSELVRFEQRPDDPATLGGIFRLIHTIKGTCGFLGLVRLQAVAHAAENVLGGFRDGAAPVDKVAVSAVLDALDLIRALTDALAESGAEPAGDDSALIARLDAVLHAGSVSEAETTAPPEPQAASETRSLIEQLGGDATLDAASETAVLRAQADPVLGPLLAQVDPDRLQSAVRESLADLARRVRKGGVFAKAWNTFAAEPLAPSMVVAAFDLAAEALRGLDIGEPAIDALRDLALEPSPPKMKLTPAPAPAPAPASPLQAEPAAAVASQVLLSGASQPNAPPAAAGEGAGPAQTIRVSLDALEHLMTVVSELVLIRNQLIQTLRLETDSPFAAPLNRLNQVTSELQEGVMATRMQPISGAWAKLPRMVRDLAQELGKQIDLVMIGQETELDRQVLELIKDPLTHMIRNAADHGLEGPAERRAAGKSESGRITLQARHEGGAIMIEVADDGRGLSPDKIRAKAVRSGLLSASQAEQMSDAEARQLIFLAGFSTADQVTAVSGRGVGMDVVRTNIERIGGAVELASAEGVGTRFTIRIPLTLTIVSALIVECCGERFAMPQSSVVELVSASGASGRTIEHIDGTAVLRLRDRLLPLVSLQTLLALQPADEPPTETCIVVARVGAFTFGVIVDRVFDTEEIVVKPVASVLRHLKLYSGATILGDGAVILILDLKGVSIETGAGQGAGLQDEVMVERTHDQEGAAILVFRAANDTLKAAPLASVSRIEEVAAHQIERVEGRTVIQYRGKLMPIVSADAKPVEGWDGPGLRPLLVFTREDRAIGLLVTEIVDIVETVVATDLESARPGTCGSLIIDGRATEMIDVAYYWRSTQIGVDRTLAAAPLAAAPEPRPAAAASDRRLLVIDQSPFSQFLLSPLLSQAGYEVTVAADPDAALALYDAGERFQLIMADTSDPEEARGLAAAFARAEGWHTVPLLSLALHSKGVATGLDRTTLLDTVSDALGGLKGAA